MIEIAYSACELSLPLTRQLDALCDQFEQSLRAGQHPEIHVLVEQVDLIAQSKLLTELVGMEWEYWLQRGFEDPTEKMVARHPNLAKRIEPILAHRASASRAAGASTDALQANRTTLTTNGLLVRCPHCHAAFQLLVDAPLTDITCHSCENRFSLTGSALDPQQAKIITQIGRFELIDRLGIGAFGTVWKARDVELDRIVAIKIPRRAQSEEENERFLREARAAAQLQHPNIVPVLEVGRDQDRIYIVSEFIAGKSLAAILKSQRLDHREAVRLMAQIADALDYAHQKGVIHRDMKPSNVILDMAGQPHVADFGLAKREMGESTLTLEGQVLGTPAYMSPEQARGETRRTASQSDIYSLGVMLFELLTGGLPFRGSTPLLLHLAIHEQAPSPRRVDPTVPRDLETITLKCLEKEPALRYQSAHRLADDLTHFLRSEPIIARPLAPYQRGWRWVQRSKHQSVFRVAVMGLFVAAVVAIGSALSVRHADRLAGEADARAFQQTAERAALEYANQINAAYTAWQQGWPMQARRLLHLAQPEPNRTDRRGLEWRLLDSLTRSPQPRVLAGHRGAVNEVAAFPDQRRVASVGEDGMLKIWDAVTGNCLRTIDFGKALPSIDLSAGGLHSVAVCPDGRYVVAGADVVGLCDLQRDGEVRELFRAEHNVESLAFSSDGLRVAAGIRYRGSLLVSLTGEVLNRLPGFTRANSVDYLPEQRQWLVSHMPVAKTPSFLQYLAADFSRVVQTIDLDQLPDKSALDMGRIAPNGSCLAAGSYMDSTLHLLDVKTSRVVATTPEYRANLSDFHFAPDGKTLAIGYRNGAVRCLRLHYVDGIPVIHASNSQTFQAHGEMTRCVRFIDSERLVTCGTDGLVKVWEPFNVPGRTPISPEFAMPMATALSPDAKRMLTSCRHLATLTMHDVQTGARLIDRPFPTPAQAIWSATGRQVAVRSDHSRQVHVLDSRLQEQFTIDCPHEVKDIDFSPDGNSLATIDQDELVVYLSENGQLTRRQPHPLVDSGLVLRFSHDGEWLAYGGNGVLLGMWNLQETSRSVELPSTCSTYCLAISSDDKQLASGHSDGIVRLWQLDEAKLLAELVGHSKSVSSVHFSQDGRTLVSTSTDSTSRVWSVAQQRCLGVLNQTVLDISPSEQQLVFGYPDQSVNDRLFPTTFIQSID